MRVAVAAFVTGVVGLAELAAACPFCTAIKPTFAQQRETAVAVVLGELDDPAKGAFRVHRVWPKDIIAADQPLTLKLSFPAAAHGLYWLLAQGESTGKPGDWDWSAAPVDEVTMAYYVRAPNLRQPTSERLAYFTKFLENEDAGIADDAFNEFGHAAFPEVAAVADQLPMAKLRAWVADTNIPQSRQGFYGMALGLAKADEDREQNAKLLRSLIAADKTDFRAGFDGQIAGLLLLEGEAGLQYLSDRILNNPEAKLGDLKHAQTALRFYHEFGKKIPADKLAVATRALLQRKGAAAAAVIDLARWNDWAAAADVARLWSHTAADETDTRKAVVAFLRTCPTTEAAQLLEKLRTADPTGVAAAEAEFDATGKGK